MITGALAGGGLLSLLVSTILPGLAGMLTTFVPEILKIWKAGRDQAHELAMMKTRAELAEREHAWKMEEINVQGDIEEARLVRQPQQSWGIQLLDAASTKGWPVWMLAPAFYLFVLLDALNSFVRPAVALAAFGFYGLLKYAQYQALSSVTVDAQWFDLVVRLWTEYDQATLTMVLGFFFGPRVAKWAMGKQSAHG